MFNVSRKAGRKVLLNCLNWQRLLPPTGYPSVKSFRHRARERLEPGLSLPGVQRSIPTELQDGIVHIYSELRRRPKDQDVTCYLSGKLFDTCLVNYLSPAWLLAPVW